MEDEAVQLENEVIDAMMVLVGDHGYSEADLNRLVVDALTG